MVAQSTRLIQMAQEQIDSFERRYGSVAANFACHAAFPLSLTTELSYCLREKFFPNPALWSIAPQLLLSGLCDRKGHDLYVMDFSVRGALLKKLLENEKFGKDRLDKLADFMAGYILDGISQKTRDFTHEQIFSERSRVFGYPPAIIKFTALSLLKQDSELTAIIKQELQDLLRQTTNPRDRLQLAMFVENQDNLLESIGLTSFSLLDLAQSIADDISGDELGHIQEVMKQQKFPALQQQIIEYQTVDFVKNAVDTGDALYSFETVNGKDKAFGFQEPLGNGIGLEMVAMPSGKFMMGASAEVSDIRNRELPQHEVTFKPFFIGRYSITASQWRVVAKYPLIDREIDLNRPFGGNDNDSIEWISWEEAQEFCKRLSAHTGRNYCLPSEAQWEYSCSYKEKQGLQDMLCHVWQWCEDDWHSDYDDAPNDGSAWIDEERNDKKVIRGGARRQYDRCNLYSRAYYSSSDHILSLTSKATSGPNMITGTKIGFRVCCT